MTFLLPKNRLREFVQAVTAFCWEHRSGPVFKTWPREKVWTYVGFCSTRRMCAVAIEKGRIVTVAFGWPAWGEHVEARAAAGAPEFTWSNPIQGGDSIFIAEVIGDRRHLRTLYDTLGEWCPDLDERKIFTYRRGKLVELSQKTMQRLIYGREKGLT